jgi:hypothetical protein
MASAPVTPPSTKLCIGCGKDHAPGEGCGYDREIEWFDYGAEERLKHIRLFPVLVGLAATAVTIFFLVRPPDNPIYLYVGVALPGIVALLFLGFGGNALVTELRKKRFRALSKDGRDRALLVFVKDQLHYGFGESLKYEPVVLSTELQGADMLRSGAALALGDELAELVDPTLASWLRRDSSDETLLRDPRAPEARLALVVAMTVIGLAAREEIALYVGRYKSWGRGGGKMPKTTPGFEVALDARAKVSDEMPSLERRILAATAPSELSPTALDALVDALLEGSDAEAFLGSFGESKDADLDTAREVWMRAQEEETELVMRLLQHVLPGRPRTIGAESV